MKWIKSVSVEGISSSKEFYGRLTFESGINLVNAENGFGKTLITHGIGWCLGLEKMSVSADSDVSYFSEAVRDKIELQGSKNINVRSSRAEVKLVDVDHANDVTLSRSISPSSEARAIAIKANSGKIEKFRLGPSSLSNENTGFQANLFKLFKWNVAKAKKYDGNDSYVYWENLGCLFFIDQLGGWSDIQSQQVRRYGTLEIEQYAIEYTLGLNTLLNQRYLRQSAASAQRFFKERVQSLYEKINRLLVAGETIDELTTQNISPSNLWSKIETLNLRELFRSKVNFDFQTELSTLKKGLELIDKEITGQGQSKTGDEYQKALSEVIARRERLASVEKEITSLSSDIFEDESINRRLEQKMNSAKDLLVLKREGLGLRARHHSCPTCHQDVAPESEVLGTLSADQVEEFIKQTSREKKVIENSIDRSQRELLVLSEKRREIESDLDSQVRVLDVQKQITEDYRARLFRLFTRRNDLETKISRIKEDLDLLSQAEKDLEQIKVEFGCIFSKESETVEVEREKEVLKQFEDKFKELLSKIDLSIFKIDPGNIARIKLDEDYRPIFNGRELKNLASASDQARIIFPYLLALMDTALRNNGNHPGFLIADEPVQQNPDENRRPSLISFLGNLPSLIKGQVIIFSSLKEEELTTLSKSKITVQRLKGQRFLGVK